MLSLLKKIRNWLILSRFTSIYIITYNCDGVIDVFVIEAKSKREAIRKTYEEGNKRNCILFRILEISEH